MQILLLCVQLLQLPLLLTPFLSYAATALASPLLRLYAEAPIYSRSLCSWTELSTSLTPRTKDGALTDVQGIVRPQYFYVNRLLNRKQRAVACDEWQWGKELAPYTRDNFRVQRKSISELGFVAVPKWSKRMHLDSRISVRSTSLEAPEVYLSPCQAKLGKLQDGKDRSGRYFIAHLGGRPRWMEVGRFYDCNRIKQRVGSRIVLLRILRVGEADGTTRIGRPFLENYQAWATILQHFRGPKVHVAKHRPKKWFKYIRGHRQEMTRLRIDSLERVPHDRGRYRTALDDPMLAALMAVRRYEKPSLYVPLLRRQALAKADKKEMSLLGPDALAVLDPPLNRLVVDRLVSGRTEVLPILGEDIPPGDLSEMG